MKLASEVPRPSSHPRNHVIPSQSNRYDYLRVRLIVSRWPTRPAALPTSSGVSVDHRIG